MFDPAVERDLALHYEEIERSSAASRARQPLADVPSHSLKDPVRAGRAMARLQDLYRRGLQVEQAGKWHRYVALWGWHRLRLWEHMDMTQDEAVVSLFGISRGTFFNAVRAVEALRIQLRIPTSLIVGSNHQTVWYALADAVLAGREVTREDAVGWLQAEGPASTRRMFPLRLFCSIVTRDLSVRHVLSLSVRIV